jgi:hypothetical protein
VFRILICEVLAAHMYRWTAICRGAVIRASSDIVKLRIPRSTIRIETQEELARIKPLSSEDDGHSDSMSSYSGISDMSMPTSVDSGRNIEDHVMDRILRSYLNDVLQEFTVLVRDLPSYNPMSRATGDTGSDDKTPIQTPMDQSQDTSNRKKRRRRDGQKRTGNDGPSKPGDSGNESSSEDEQQDPRRRKLRSGLPRRRIPSLKLACPFYKRNPGRHLLIRSCKGPGWDTAHRVK